MYLAKETFFSFPFSEFIYRNGFNSHDFRFRTHVYESVTRGNEVMKYLIIISLGTKVSIHIPK